MRKVPRYSAKKDASTNIVTILSHADIPASSLWDLELLGIWAVIEQNSREETEKRLFYFLKTGQQKEDVKYEVRMPWKVNRDF